MALRLELEGSEDSCCSVRRTRRSEMRHSGCWAIRSDTHRRTPNSGWLSRMSESAERSSSSEGGDGMPTRAARRPSPPTRAGGQPFPAAREAGPDVRSRGRSAGALGSRTELGSWGGSGKPDEGVGWVASVSVGPSPVLEGPHVGGNTSTTPVFPSGTWDLPHKNKTGLDIIPMRPAALHPRGALPARPDPGLTRRSARPSAATAGAPRGARRGSLRRGASRGRRGIRR